jgi:hypothetical protein
MEFLEPGNFNGIIFRYEDGMVYFSEIDKWVPREEYEAYKMEQINQLNNRK